MVRGSDVLRPAHIARIERKRRLDSKRRIVAARCNPKPVFEVGDYAVYISELGGSWLAYWFPDEGPVGKLLGVFRAEATMDLAVEYLCALAKSDEVWAWALQNFPGDPVNRNKVRWGVEFGTRREGWRILVNQKTNTNRISKNMDVPTNRSRSGRGRALKRPVKRGNQQPEPLQGFESWVVSRPVDLVGVRLS